MVDIHNHLLPFLDDGSNSISDSVSLVKDLYKAGVTDIIFTPHYKELTYEPSIKKINDSYENFKLVLKDEKLPINLYLGQEIYVKDNIYSNLENKKVLTMNNTKYVLIEFNYYEETDVGEYVYNLVQKGYKPIIAHVERYRYLDFSSLSTLKELGALIQVNTQCITGKYGAQLKKRALKAIKDGYVDFVASDIHTGRKTCILKAYKTVKKHLGEDTAKKVFETNARKYLID